MTLPISDAEDQVMTEREIADLARRFVATSGRDKRSRITNEVTSRSVRLGGFYIRIRTADGCLYANNMDDRLGRTVFSEEANSITRAHDLDGAVRLFKALRQAMVLDDLANV